MEVLDKLRDKLLERYNSDGYKASGNWGSRLNVSKESTVGKYKESLLAPEYTNQLVNGTPPGSIVPINEIIEWLSDKGLDINPFAIQKSIYKRGSKLYRSGGSNLLEGLSEGLEDAKNGYISNLVKDIKETKII